MTDAGMNIVSTPKEELNIKKLKAGRIDLWVTLRERLNLLNVSELVEVLLAEETSAGIACNLAVDDATISSLQQSPGTPFGASLPTMASTPFRNVTGCAGSLRDPESSSRTACRQITGLRPHRVEISVSPSASCAPGCGSAKHPHLSHHQQPPQHAPAPALPGSWAGGSGSQRSPADQAS